MKRQLVSVCIPAYNAADFIGEALKSILNQTYQNLEILVGDNCSTDDTAKIVSDFQGHDARVFLLRHERNLGFAGNMNRLLAAASSDYVAFYHADDVYDPDIIAREMALFQTNPALDGVFCKAIYFHNGDSSSGRPQKQKFLERGALRSENGYIWGRLNEFLPLLFQHGNVFVCPTFLGRKAALIAAGEWDARYPGLEDIYMWVRLLASGCALAIIPEALIHYRVHDSSTTSSLTTKLPGRMKETQHQLLNDFLVEHPELDTGKMPLSAYARRRARELLNIGSLCLTQGDVEQFLAYSKQSIAIYRYPLYSKRFIQQRLPSLYIAWQKRTQGKS